MRCPECVNEGKKSKVYIGNTEATLLFFYPYYDEDGKFHMNDPNQYTTNYRCNNGHKWTKTTGGLDEGYGGHA
jgi:hypothetical protein